VELELFHKFATSKKDFNKKEYRKQYLMLMRNLKQKHNDDLVRYALE
jgi:hypothetical protein